MIEYVFILSAALLAIGLYFITYAILKCPPGNILLSKDPIGDLEELITLRKRFDEEIDESMKASLGEELHNSAKRIAQRRYRMYPHAFIKNGIVAVLLTLACVIAFSVAEYLEGAMYAAYIIWLVIGFTLFVLIVVLSVMCINGLYLPYPYQSREGRKYTYESMSRLPASIYLPLMSTYTLARQFGGYALIDARSYQEALLYPLPGSMPYERSDEPGLHIGPGEKMSTVELHHMIPDEDMPIFVVSEFGIESNQVVEKLRDQGYRHAYDLGGVTNSYGKVATVSFVLNVLYGDEPIYAL